MENLGRKLREEREERGLSLNDVHNVTKIRVKYLKAIEEGRFSEIPGEVYLKGFIKNYANYLGLDGGQMIREYEQIKEEKRRQELQEKEAEEEQEKEGWLKFFHDRRILNITVIGLLIVLLVFIFYSVYLLNNASREANVLIQEQETYTNAPADQSMNTADDGDLQEQISADQGIKPGQELEEQEKNQNSGVKKPAAEEMLKMHVEVLDRTWFRLIIDGEQMLEKTLLPGEEYNWQGQEIKMVIGNAGGLKVYLNGKDIGKLGRDGEVVTKIFKLNHKEQ